MSVTLRPVALLKNYVGGQEQVELPVGGTVAELLESVGIPPALVAVVTRGKDLSSKSYTPQDGETITVLPMIHGG